MSIDFVNIEPEMQNRKNVFVFTSITESNMTQTTCSMMIRIAHTFLVYLFLVRHTDAIESQGSPRIIPSSFPFTSSDPLDYVFAGLQDRQQVNTWIIRETPSLHINQNQEDFFEGHYQAKEKCNVYPR